MREDNRKWKWKSGIVGGMLANEGVWKRDVGIISVRGPTLA